MAAYHGKMVVKHPKAPWLSHHYAARFGATPLPSSPGCRTRPASAKVSGSSRRRRRRAQAVVARRLAARRARDEPGGRRHALRLLRQGLRPQRAAQAPRPDEVRGAHGTPLKFVAPKFSEVDEMVDFMGGGGTPLHRASGAMVGSVKNMQKLIENGAKNDGVDRYGQLPIDNLLKFHPDSKAPDILGSGLVPPAEKLRRASRPSDHEQDEHDDRRQGGARRRGDARGGARLKTTRRCDVFECGSGGDPGHGGVRSWGHVLVRVINRCVSVAVMVHGCACRRRSFTPPFIHTCGAATNFTRDRRTLGQRALADELKLDKPWRRHIHALRLRSVTPAARRERCRARLRGLAAVAAACADLGLVPPPPRCRTCCSQLRWPSCAHTSSKRSARRAQCWRSCCTRGSALVSAPSPCA